MVSLFLLPTCSAFLTPKLAFKKFHIKANHRGYLTSLRATPVSEMEDVPLHSSSNTTSSSSIPFPRSSYHFMRDEEEISHDFISFIDHLAPEGSYTQAARLMEPRGYARSNQFDGEQVTSEIPSIDDVACVPSPYGPMADMLAWSHLPARIVVGTLAYFTFPIIVDLMESYTSVDYLVQDSLTDLSFYERLRILVPISAGVDPDSPVSLSISEEEREHLATLVNLYLPGVSIVLGTYTSLTLDILYTRFSQLQKAVSKEASLLAYCFQLLQDLFAKDLENLIASTQCIANQIHVLVRDSRGKETMRIIYNDPYANILRIVQEHSRQPDFERQDASLVGDLRGCVRQLFAVRSERLNCEANGLSPTHFDIMTFLAGLLLIGIALGTVATAQTNGIPTEVSRILFSALVVCYTTIYEMAYDLNRPFDGIYQIRRSGAAMHFLQIKHMVASHPLLRDHITFDPSVEEDESDETEFSTVDRNEQRDLWYN